MREIFLIIICILFIVCYIKAAYCIDDNKLKGILYIAAMLFMFGALFTLSLTLINQNDELEKKVKGKDPQYEEVRGVYKLKGQKL